MSALRTVTACERWLADGHEDATRVVNTITPQGLHFLLIRRLKFGDYDGNELVALLRDHRDWWSAVVLCHDPNLLTQICDLDRDLSRLEVTLHLVPKKGRENDLIGLVAVFDPSEIRRVSMQEKVAMFADPRHDQPLLSAWWSQTLAPRVAPWGGHSSSAMKRQRSESARSDAEEVF